MEHENITTLPLPFGEPAALEFSAGAVAVALAPLAPGEAPRVELAGHLARAMRVDISREGNLVRVAVEAQEPLSGMLGWWGFGPRARLTLFVPRDVRARVRSSLGRIRAWGLSGCELDIEGEAGGISLQDIRG